VSNQNQDPFDRYADDNEFIVAHGWPTVPKGKHDMPFGHGYAMYGDRCMKCGLTAHQICNDNVAVCTGPDVNDPASWLKKQLAVDFLDMRNPEGHA
jgi:hypothetical protein